MNTTDEIAAAKNAWILWKSLAELDSLLWNLYGDEFLDFDEQERTMNSIETF